MKGLRDSGNLCGLSDRSVSFGMVYAPQLRDALSRAKDAKDGKEILFFKNLCGLSDRSVRFLIGGGGAMLIIIFDVFTLGFFLFGVDGSRLGWVPCNCPCGHGKTDSDDSGGFLWAEL